MAVSTSRLKLAREIAGLSKRALAEELSLSPSTITGYEDGTISALDNLPRIAVALGMPGLESFFMEPDLPDVPESAISFRARRSLLKSTRGRAIALSQLAAFVITPFLEERFVLPEPDIPDGLPPTPEAAATALRNYWGLGKGPISNVVHLLEAKGALVYFLLADSRSVDAFNYTIASRPFVFLNTFKTAGERGRFDAAHELGHLVLHRDVDHSRMDSKAIEDEANDFASAFLMPSEQFRLECPRGQSLEAFLRLKPRWGVSAQAMIRRARDLGLLSQWHYESMFRHMSSLGWRSGSEAGALTREESSLHFQAFNHLTDAGLKVSDIARLLNLSLDQLFELAPASRLFKDDGRTRGFLKVIEQPAN